MDKRTWELTRRVADLEECLSELCESFTSYSKALENTGHVVDTATVIVILAALADVIKAHNLGA